MENEDYSDVLPIGEGSLIIDTVKAYSMLIYICKALYLKKTDPFHIQAFQLHLIAKQHKVNCFHYLTPFHHVHKALRLH